MRNRSPWDALAVLGWLLVLAPAAFLFVTGLPVQIAETNGATRTVIEPAPPFVALYPTLATLAIVGHWRRHVIGPAGALLAFGFSVLAIVSFGIIFALGSLMMVVALFSPALRKVQGIPHAAILAGVLGVGVVAPSLVGEAAALLDPCASFRVGGLEAKTAAADCTTVRGTAVEPFGLAARITLLAAGLTAVAHAFHPRAALRMGAIALFLAAALVGLLSPFLLLGATGALLLWWERPAQKAGVAGRTDPGHAPG